MQLINQLKLVFRYYRYLAFTKVEENENILIYGISRGGTTMLAEILTNTLNARLVWEPFFKHKKVFLAKINPFSTHRYNELKLNWNPFILEGSKQQNDYFDDLFNLKEKNLRFWRYTNFGKYKNQKYTVFKFCFGNYLYPYLQKKYNQKSIILLRHPFSIAASSLNFGNNFDWHKKEFNNWNFTRNQLNSEFILKLDSKRNLIKSPFTLLVFQIVAQYCFVLEYMDITNTIVVFYEDLVVNPEKVRQSLESNFDLKLDKETFINSANSESFSSGKGHTLNDKQLQLSKWKEKSSEEDIQLGLRIFQELNFKLYSEDIYPATFNPSDKE